MADINIFISDLKEEIRGSIYDALKEYVRVKGNNSTYNGYQVSVEDEILYIDGKMADEFSDLQLASVILK